MPILEFHSEKSHCFYYSVNSYLSHYINENFYEGIHYVWCAENFVEKRNPPSSNPKEIFLSLQKDVNRCDKHSFKIESNKLGIVNGAELMLSRGLITQEQRDEILLLVNNAESELFSPLLYVIAKDKILERIETVPRLMRANLLSSEFLISNLKTDEFDIISFDCE
ncbi:hypothetical protein OBV_24890 [Oscillibacter valericigenes Sjm18-20]|nr:hypothetical protein OBV_24890 [Oscillibacter valericigenes Sjm18-20]